MLDSMPSAASNLVLDDEASTRVLAAETLTSTCSRATAQDPQRNSQNTRAPRTLSGNSQAIRQVIGLIRQVAAHDSTVLILGESGTGKEVAARSIHELSPRRSRPFVAINCGAIPAELLESELFGHEKGSFTGALSARKGRFEIAEGGTLFLDEIGDMSIAMQVKLLRVLQERVFERVGNHVPVNCNVRIIAATHRNLEESISRGTFREDLFHRLNVFPIEMPALRSRIEDLPLLVNEFVARNVAAGRNHLQLSGAVIATLARCSWSGNVRELSNLIERLSITCGGRVVQVADLPVKYKAGTDGLISGIEDDSALRTPALMRSITSTAGDEKLDNLEVLRVLEAARDSTESPEAATPAAVNGAEAQLPLEGIDLRAHVAAIESRLIEQALQRANGTVAHAARLLNLRRTTLVEKLRKLDICAAERLTED
jgi:sigma-54 specific flagellar transcriptional regulator A